MPLIHPERGPNEEWCSKCNSFKERSDFHVNRTRSRGLNPWCKSCISEYGKSRREKNAAKWRTAKRNGEGPWWKAKLKRNNIHCTIDEISEKYKTSPYCLYCGVFLLPEDVSLDHILPRSKGGSDKIENLAISCIDCNRMKHTRTGEEFSEFMVRYALRVLANRGQAGRKAVQPERLSEAAPDRVMPKAMRQSGLTGRKP